MEKVIEPTTKCCFLCIKNEANQTGSHIISHSIIKKAINYKGRKVRDKESSFRIQLGENLKVKYFAGKSLLPEEREEDLEKINQNIESISQNPDTEDYIFCKECENRFTGIENSFSGKILKNLENFKGNQISHDLSEILSHMEFTKVNESAIIKLFFLIQLWRASVSKTNEFKLKRKIEEKLRKALLMLSSDVKKINFLSIHELLNDFAISLFYMENDVESDTTDNIIELNPNLNIPYFAVLNQFVVIMYEKKKQSSGILSELLGLGRCKNINDFLSIGLNSNIKIAFLNNKQRELVLKSFYNESVEFQFKFWENKIKYIHSKFFSEPISKFDLAQIKSKTYIKEEDSWENMREKIYQSGQNFILTKLNWYKINDPKRFNKILIKVYQLFK